MKKFFIVLFWWFVIQSESGQLLEIGPFIDLESPIFFKRGCKQAQESVVDAKIVIPCFFKANKALRAAPKGTASEHP